MTLGSAWNVKCALKNKTRRRTSRTRGPRPPGAGGLSGRRKRGGNLEDFIQVMWFLPSAESGRRQRRRGGDHEGRPGRSFAFYVACVSGEAFFWSHQGRCSPFRSLGPFPPPLTKNAFLNRTVMVFPAALRPQQGQAPSRDSEVGRPVRAHTRTCDRGNSHRVPTAAGDGDDALASEPSWEE